MRLDRMEGTAGSGSFARGVGQKATGAKPKSLVRPVSEVTVELEGETAFEAARREVLRWMSPRAGRRLPDDA